DLLDGAAQVNRLVGRRHLPLRPGARGRDQAHSGGDEGRPCDLMHGNLPEFRGRPGAATYGSTPAGGGYSGRAPAPRPPLANPGRSFVTRSRVRAKTARRGIGVGSRNAVWTKSGTVPT